MNHPDTTLKTQSTTTKAYVMKITLVAALGGLLFGYDTAVIAGAIGFLQIKFSLSPTMTGWVASSAIWGCVVGAMCAGYLSDRIGRKKVLILTAILFAISSVGSALPENLPQFILFRTIGGLGIGAASMLSPLYISEIAPARNRGTLVSIYQLAVVLGINLIYFVNLKIASVDNEAWNVAVGWRYMLGSGLIPAVLFLFLLFFVPESPRWLVKKGNTNDALKILKHLNSENRAHEVLHEIQTTLNLETGTFRELFKPGLRMAMIVGGVLALFCQITGINAIIYYAPEIFKSVGFASGSALFQTVIIGIVNSLFTFVAIWLIDRVGRKTLLLWGISGMILCLLGTGLCFYFQITNGPWLLIFILGYIAFFASSLGPIPWVIISEIFPTKVRGQAMSFCTVILWIGVLLITQFTPVLMQRLGGAYTFWLFMINAIILFVFTLKIIPETKRRTLEDIEKIWALKISI